MLALGAAGVQSLGGSLKRPAAEDGVALGVVAGAAFFEVAEDFFRVVRGAGWSWCTCKKKITTALSFAPRDNHVLGCW